jgi:DNA polymerase elongation subunit (family B)
MLEVFIFNSSFNDDEDGLRIRLYGMTEKSEYVYCDIQDFPISCYLEIPENWSQFKIDCLINHIKTKTVRDHKPIKIEKVLKKKLYYANKTPDNTDKLFRFLSLSFRRVASLKWFNFLFSKPIKIDGAGEYKLKLHEENISNSRDSYGVSPILKLFANRQIPSTGWIQIKDKFKRVKDKDKSCSYDIELECSYESLFPLQKDTLMIPKTLSIDFEANSSRSRKGNSCMPKADLPPDELFQMSCIIIDKGIVTKHGFSITKPNELFSKLLDDCVIHECGTEDKLLLEFTNFINQENPKVIIGYNILGWDYEYLRGRAIFRKIIKEVSKFGCIDGLEYSDFVEPQFKSKAYGAQKLTYFDMEGRLNIDLLPVIKRNYKLENYRLSTVTTHFKVPTKDDISKDDIFEAYNMYRNKSEKFPKSVSKWIIDEYEKYKDEVSPYVFFMTLIMKYCIQDAYCTYLLYKKIQMWYELCQMSKVGSIPIFYTFSQGTQIQMLSQVLAYSQIHNYVVISNGYVAKEGDEYAGATVLEPIPGKYKKVLSFDFSSLYPSIMLAYNICYSTFVLEPEHYLISIYDTENYKSWNNYPCFIQSDYYEYDDEMRITKHEHVWEEVDDNDDLIFRVENLKKKYPKNIIIIFKEKSNIPDEHCNVFEWEEHQNCCHDLNRQKLKNGEFSKAKKKVYCNARRFRFMKESIAGKGVVPTLLLNHLNKRKEVRKKIAKNEEMINIYCCQVWFWLQKYRERNSEYEKQLSLLLRDFKDSFTDIDKMQLGESNDLKTNTIRFEEDISNHYKLIIDLDELNQVLDKSQLALKINANSMYGAMGVKRGFLPLLPGAMCVTYKGRKSIEFISNYIPKRWNGKSVYGDTDSNHVFFPSVLNNEDLLKLAEDVIGVMSTFKHFFPPPMNLDFEKIYEFYIILTKKRYIAKVSNKKGEIIAITKRGCVLVRRDNCKALKVMYQNIVDMLLEDKTAIDILDYVVSEINNLFTWKYSYKTFTVTKGFTKEDYTAKTKPAHVQLVYRMRERGIPIPVGARIEYLFTTRFRGEKHVIQGEKVEDVDYFGKWKTILRLDYLYYLEKQFVKPIDELLKVGLGIDGFMKTQYEIRLNHYRMIQEINGINMPDLNIDGEIIPQYIPTKIKGKKQGGEKKKKRENKDGCKFILKSGKNAGRCCGRKIKQEDCCSIHYKKNQEEKDFMKNQKKLNYEDNDLVLF